MEDVDKRLSALEERIDALEKGSERKVAFDLTKSQLRKIYQNTMGPQGQKARIQTKLSGYELYAVELERAQKNK